MEARVTHKCPQEIAVPIMADHTLDYYRSPMRGRHVLPIIANDIQPCSIRGGLHFAFFASGGTLEMLGMGGLTVILSLHIASGR